MKRADLTTLLVLGTVKIAKFAAWEILTRAFPPKLVLAALEREVRAGYLDYGVALHRPWLTDKGRAKLDEESSNG